MQNEMYYACTMYMYMYICICKNFTIHQLVQCVWRICEMMISHNLTVYVQYYTLGFFFSMISLWVYAGFGLTMKGTISSNFSQHKNSETTQKSIEQWGKKIRYYQYNIFLPSKYFLDMFHVHFLYTIREIQIYITDYMHCRLALFYIWQMTRVR